MGKNREVLLGLTTTAQNGNKNHWRDKIAEIDELGIKKIALFPTVMGPEERKDLYALLEKSGLENIPHVHLRDDDMDKEELEYLIKRYKVQVFNLHPSEKAYAFLDQNSEYREMTFIENLYQLVKNERFSEVDFENHKVAGICLDMAHLTSEQLLFPEKYQERIKLLDKYQIGCNHISGIMKKPYLWEGVIIYDTHFISDLSELDYLKEFPKKYFSDTISIELENSFEEQLKFKKYIENIISSKK